MVKDNSKFSIEYPFEFKAIRKFIAIDIERKLVSDFCRNLLFLVRDKFQGGIFTFPNEKEEKTQYWFMWQIPWYGINYGLKLGIMFDVDNESLSDSFYFATYGDGSSKKGKEPKFTEKELKLIEHYVQNVVDQALELIEKEDESFHFVYHAEVYFLLPITKMIKLSDFGIIIYPTIMMKKDNKRVSAFVISVREKTILKAKEKAIEKISELMMLLAVSFGTSYNISALQWSKNQKRIETIDSIKKLPEMKQIYPRGKWVDNIGPDYTEFENTLKKILTMYNALQNKDRQMFKRAITAYYFGQALNITHPTLAIISFLAAISSFVKEVKCKGKIECSECGSIKNFQHSLQGERVSIIELITNIFDLENNNEKILELTNLINRLYQKHRSSFVHNAIIRFREDTKYGIPAALPTENAPFDIHHIYRLDLMRIQTIVRQVILLLLSKHSDISLDKKAFGCEKLIIDELSKYDILFTIPAKTQVKIGGTGKTKNDKYQEIYSHDLKFKTKIS